MPDARRIAPLPREVREVLALQERVLTALRDRDSVRRLMAVGKAARDSLAARLSAGSVRLGAFGPEMRFTGAQRRVFLVQLEAVLADLQRRLGIAMNAVTDLATAQATRDAVARTRAAAAAFPGVVAPLPLEEAIRIVNRDTKMREVQRARNAQGAQAYAAQQMEMAEREMAKAMLAGETTFQAQQRVLGRSIWDEPWKAERLARTEFSHAYNGVQRKVLDETASMDPALFLMWTEFAEGPEWGGYKDTPWPGTAKALDGRVGDDSLRLHGQLRRRGEPFIDPLTKERFMHPPNRPNDRATLVLVYDKDALAAALKTRQAKARARRAEAVRENAEMAKPAPSGGQS